MSKKSILRSKESAATAAPHPEIYEESSSDGEEKNIAGESAEGADAHHDGRKKNRIPWDRDVHCDKNGMKMALLKVVAENRFHVDGRYMDNFRIVANLLSQPGGLFDRYQGIEPSGAQRKFNQIIKEVAKSFEMTPDGEFSNEHEAVGFEVLALEIIKDMVEKEKEKQLSRNQYRMTKTTLPSGTFKGNVGPQGTTLLRKRKCEIVPMKAAFRKAALVGADTEADSEQSTARVDSTVRNEVLENLQQQSPAIKTVEDVLKAADVSPTGIAAFASTTHIKLDKPADRVLRLYEDIFSDRDYVRRACSLMGFNTADAVELDSYLRSKYDNILSAANSTK